MSFSLTLYPLLSTSSNQQDPCFVASRTADSGVTSSILARSHTCVDHEIISMVILHLPLIQEGLLSVTRESMFMKHWLTA